MISPIGASSIQRSVPIAPVRSVYHSEMVRLPAARACGAAPGSFPPAASGAGPGCVFQRALDPLAPPKPPRPLRHDSGAAEAARRLPSSSMLSNRPGETFEPVTATRTGWNACRGFRPSRRPSPVAPSRSASLERLDVGERLLGRREHRPRRRAVGSGSTSPKRKPRSPGTRRASRSSPARGAPPRRARRPTRSRSRRARGRAGARTPAGGARGGRPRSSSRASVVELRRAGADPLEREALDSSSCRMIVVSPSGAQPSSARKFISASGRYPSLRNSSTVTAPWRFESFLPSAPLRSARARRRGSPRRPPG